MPGGKRMANTWIGNFPAEYAKRKRAHRTTRVGTYPPNDYGLFDMIGNVWEWTDSWFQMSGELALISCCCPPEDSYDPDRFNIRILRRVLKGGSFLCAEKHCAQFRPAATATDDRHGIGAYRIPMRGRRADAGHGREAMNAEPNGSAGQEAPGFRRGRPFGRGCA